MQAKLFRQIVYLLAFSIPLCADQLVLTNGDTLTGTIVKKEGGKLTFKSDVLGEVSVPWASVRSLTSKDVTVIAPGGKEYTGPVTTSGAALQIVTPSGPQTTPLADVTDVRNSAEWQRLRHPGLTQLWAGSFDLGFALARGNAHTDTLTTAFTATRLTLHDKASVYFNQIRGSARLNGVNATVANAIRGGWAYNHNLAPRVSLGVFNDYEHDVFQNLDLRFVLGGDLGFNAIKTEMTNLALLAGADYERESFSPSLTRSSAEVMFGDDLVHKLSSATVVTQSFRIFPNVSNTGQYRLSFDLNAVTALKKWLGWQLSASDRFLSDPPFGRQRNDILLSTGFRVSFAR